MNLDGKCPGKRSKLITRLTHGEKEKSVCSGDCHERYTNVLRSFLLNKLLKRETAPLNYSQIKMCVSLDPTGLSVFTRQEVRAKSRKAMATSERDVL